LHKAIVNHIKVLSAGFEEAAHLSDMLSLLVFWLSLWILGNVFWENIIFVIDVSTEPVVVDFLSGSLIEITSCNQSKFRSGRRHKSQCFQNSEELVSSHVLRLGSVKVTKPWFQVDSLGDDFVSQTSKTLKKCILLFTCEVSF
jgi:hypothetical protein